MTDNREQTGSGGKVKKTYSTPELTRLGAISELTAGGVGTKAEPGPTDMPPTKHP